MQFFEVIEGALADFNNFFEPESNPEITAIKKDQLEIAKAKGTDKVLIARMAANEPVGTLPLFLFTLLVLGHEIAHCVNHHNRHEDRDARDSKALEQWADFFGVRVAFTLLSFGAFTTDAAASYGEVIIPYASPDTIANATKTDRLLRGFGEALAHAHASIYLATDAAPGYPNSADRALSAAAGVYSFFFRLFGNLPERWVWKLAKTLIVGQKWVDADAYRVSGDDQIDASIKMISDLHIDISGSRHFITPGIKPEFRKLIGTHYIRTQWEKDINAAALKHTFAGWEGDAKQFVPDVFRE